MKPFTSTPLLAALVAMTLLLSGCSGLVQRIGTRYAVGQLDDVFDLDDAQEEMAEASIEHLLVELPPLVRRDIAGLVYAMDRELAASATDEGLLRIEARLDRLLEKVATRVIPEVAGLMATLEAAQVEHAMAWAREQMDDRREELQRPADERLKERQDALVDTFEEWTGDVSSGQERAIRRHVRSLPDEERTRLAVDERRLAEVERLLQRGAAADAVAALLSRQLRLREELGPGAPSVAERRARGRATLLFLDGLLGAEQRHHARRHLTSQYARIRRFLSDDVS